MDAQHIAIAQNRLDAAYGNRMSFPQIVGTLIGLGFEGYVVDYRRSASAAAPKHMSSTSPAHETAAAPAQTCRWAMKRLSDTWRPRWPSSFAFFFRAPASADTRQSRPAAVAQAFRRGEDCWGPKSRHSSGCSVVHAFRDLICRTRVDPLEREPLDRRKGLVRVICLFHVVPHTYFIDVRNADKYVRLKLDR